MSQIQLAACFCIAHKLKVIFTFLRVKMKDMTDVCGQQSLKYLLHGPLQKMLIEMDCE